MTKTELATIGRQLYGDGWKGKLAGAIGWSRFTIYRWAAGHTPVHPAAEMLIRQLAAQQPEGA